MYMEGFTVHVSTHFNLLYWTDKESKLLVFWAITLESMFETYAKIDLVFVYNC